MISSYPQLVCMDVVSYQTKAELRITCDRRLHLIPDITRLGLSKRIVNAQTGCHVGNKPNQKYRRDGKALAHRHVQLAHDQDRE